MALVDWRWFDRMVLLLILLNCVAMAASDPVAVEPYAWERPAEWFFTIAFTVEALCKMVAMGICCESRCAYIWDFWHVLDLVAVTTAWISLLPLGAGNFAVLRSVRVLRPLRTVQRVKGMRILVGSLVASLPSLLDVFELFGFLMLVFGVIGVETFAGRLHYRCVDAAGEFPLPAASRASSGVQLGWWAVAGACGAGLAPPPPLPTAAHPPTAPHSCVPPTRSVRLLPSPGPLRRSTRPTLRRRGDWRLVHVSRRDSAGHRAPCPRGLLPRHVRRRGELYLFGAQP